MMVDITETWTKHKKYIFTLAKQGAAILLIHIINAPVRCRFKKISIINHLSACRKNPVIIIWGVIFVNS